MIYLVVLSVCLVLMYLWLGVNVIIHPDYYESINENINNDYCLSSVRNGLDGLMCDNPLKKKKLLWFLFDGMAYDQSANLRDWMGKTGNMYKVNVDFFKQSGAIHEIYLTGKFSRNFVATPTKMDNLLW